jgi:hypothetical protein
MSKTEFLPGSFSMNTPNKIGDGIDVPAANSLKRTLDGTRYRVAIANEAIDAKIDAKKVLCLRVDNLIDARIHIGFTLTETFDSNAEGYFGLENFTGAGLNLSSGNLTFPIQNTSKIMNEDLSKTAKEIIVILTISNNGAKKEVSTSSTEMNQETQMFHFS